jgi:hypothetical protein
MVLFLHQPGSRVLRFHSFFSLLGHQHYFSSVTFWLDQIAAPLGYRQLRCGVLVLFQLFHYQFTVLFTTPAQPEHSEAKHLVSPTVNSHGIQEIYLSKLFRGQQHHFDPN